MIHRHSVQQLLSDPLTLARTALEIRQSRYGLSTTFVHNLHSNPTNICVKGCPICRFAVPPNNAQGYHVTSAEILTQVAEENPREVHIVGGLSPYFGLREAIELIEALRRAFPNLFIKAFTAVELHWFAQRGKVTVEMVLRDLMTAGLNALPGGGAELFDPILRKRCFPNKIDAATWLSIHRTAHSMGLTSNATMLFGIGEGWQARLEHLEQLAALQAETGGFSAFIALPAQYAEAKKRPSPLICLQVIALARIVLDAIPHIKAYWPMLGLSTAAMALGWGADDMDGTLVRERIAHAAGAETPKGMTRDAMASFILRAGYQPIERDGRFVRVS